MKNTEWIIRRTCIDKQSFSLVEAEDIVDRKARLGKLFYWYKCQFCQRYHMSRQDSSEDKIEVIGGK